MISSVRTTALIAFIALGAAACTSSDSDTASTSDSTPGSVSTAPSPFGTRADPATLAAKISDRLADRSSAGVTAFVYDVARRPGYVIADVRGTVRLAHGRITDFEVEGIGGNYIIEARRVDGATWYRTGVTPSKSPWHSLARGTGHPGARRIITQIEGAMSADRMVEFLPAASKVIRTDYGLGGFTSYRASVPAAAVPADLPDRARLVPTGSAALSFELTRDAAGGLTGLRYLYEKGAATALSLSGLGHPAKIVPPATSSP